MHTSENAAPVAVKQLTNKRFWGTVSEIVPLFLRAGRERGLSEITLLNREIFAGLPARQITQRYSMKNKMENPRASGQLLVMHPALADAQVAPPKPLSFTRPAARRAA